MELLLTILLIYLLLINLDALLLIARTSAARKTAGGAYRRPRSSSLPCWAARRGLCLA